VAAGAVRAAASASVRSGVATPDLGGTHGTRAVGEWVAAHVARAGG
jgi:isocitrate/isopropylmalate dehydrogenase